MSGRRALVTIMSGDSPSSLLTGLISYWKLDEESAGSSPVTRVDSHGSNDLTDNNTVPSAVGKVGRGAGFTLSNSEYLEKTDTADLSVGDIDFTLAAWIYWGVDTDKFILGKSNADAANGYEYALYYNAVDNTFSFAIGNGSAVQAVKASTFGAISLNTWYFVVGWHDATLQTINIQVNNTTANAAARSFAPADTNKPFRIGGNNIYITGRVDEVGFWKKLLTDAEKASLYNGGTGTTYPFPVA